MQNLRRFGEWLLCVLTFSIIAAAQGVSPSSLFFGNQALGTTSAAKTVTLKNAQPVPLTISSIVISGGTAPTDYAWSGNCPISPNALRAGLSCSITLTFAPSALAGRTASLVITDSASTSPQSVPLAGTGIAPTTLTPSSVGFGNQALGTTSLAKTVTLKNAQTVPLTISSIAVSGGTPPTDYAWSGNCPISPNTLDAGLSCSITLTYAPSALGRNTASLVLTDSASTSPQSVPLAGTGIAPTTLTPSSVGFGNQALGTTSLAKTLTLKNAQTVPLTISSIAVSGGTPPTDYAWSGNCPISPNTLGAGLSCSITLTYAPSALGRNTASLVLTDSASTSPQSVPLTGVGIAPVTVSPPSLTFPSQLVGTTSVAKILNLTNHLDSILFFSSIVASGDFAVAGNTCGSSLGAGLQCTIEVTFTPEAIGLRQGTLAINDSASVNPTLVVLSGAGNDTGLTSITVTPANFPIAAGNTLQFTATGNFKNGSTENLTALVTWKSSAPGIATITSGGLGTGVTAGTSSIGATLGSITGSTTLTVTPPVLVSISVTPANPSFALGTTQQFAATGSFTNNTTQDLTATATWTTANSNVATVNSQGLAASVAVGSTTVTATSGSITGSTPLNVIAPALVSIAVTPANPTFALGTTQQFAATGTFTNNTTQDLTATATWTTANSNVSTVNSRGLATSAAVGSTTVTATSGSVSGSTTLNVTAPSLVSIAVAPANPSIAQGALQQLIATGSYTDGSTKDLTTTSSWASSNAGVASVSAAGLATALTVGTTALSATYEEISGYTTLTVTTPQAILPRVPERVCLVENETSTASSCTLSAPIPAGDGVVLFISSVSAQTLAPNPLQDSKGNTYALLAGPVSGGFGSLYSGYSLLTTALNAGDVISLAVPGADSWGLSVYDLGPVQGDQPDVGVTFQNPDANDGLPDFNNPATGMPGWWTGQTSPTTGASDICMAALGVGPGASPDGAPSPITTFNVDGGFTNLDMTQFYAQTDPAYGDGGSLLTMYAEVPAGSSMQSHIITNNGVSNTAPAILYCVKEGVGAVPSAPWFTGNSCSGTASCTIDNVAPGHMLVISTHSFQGLPANPITITDNQPETVTFDQIDGAAGLGTWHISNVTNAGSHTLSVNDTADPTTVMNVTEIAGQAVGNPVETVAQHTYANSSLALTTLTTITPNDLLYGWGRSGFGTDEAQGFTSVRVTPTAEYAVSPASGAQIVALLPRGTPPWSLTGIQGLAIRPAGSVEPSISAPSFTGNYCVVNANMCTIDNVVAGNMLVISSMAGGALTQPPQIADSANEIFVVDRGNDTEGTVTLTTWHIAAVANAGSHTFTVDNSVKIIVTEYTAQSSANPVDAVAAAIATTGGGTASVTAETSQRNDLIYAWCATDDPMGWGDGFAQLTTYPVAEYRMAGTTPGIEAATCPSSPNSSSGWIIQELAIRH